MGGDTTEHAKATSQVVRKELAMLLTAQRGLK